MPWFNVDDSAHSHPKMIKAGNAAIGLWMRCGSYVAQHLTDGIVPGPIAEMYGTTPQIRKLLAAGLWHAAGHGCKSCPQPAGGDYYMHDYERSGNPKRADVEQRRAKAADKKRRQRAGGTTPGGDSRANRSLFDDDPETNRDGIDDDSTSFPPPHFEEDAGHGVASRGDSLGTSRARAPLHSNPLPNRGVEERELPAGSSGRAHEPTPSLIPTDWQPSDDDVRAAQLARADAGREQLTPRQLDEVTRKFVRRQLDDQRRAVAWGGRWQQWAENERIEPDGGGVVVPFKPGGAQQQTRGQQQRDGLARLMQQTGEV
ncbi:hypothetical protein AB0K09_00575 [Streptomyces sp. NPDC049577]|uniref:hypothetical protein n=1 Tax=Streptomyces sp. NPDC049577 TaxID=3155153 RepID=UPI003425339F